MEKHRFQISKLSDQTVIIEDEKKFQEYFLKEKRKVAGLVYFRPVSRDSELSMNKEIIEDNQEMIIEKEELVPAVQLPREKYLKNEKIRSSKFEQANELFTTLKKNLNSRIGGWFLFGVKLIGLKGGADNDPLKPPESEDMPEAPTKTEDR